MEKSRKRRNGTLEFWRFIFCIFVLLFHAERYILGEAPLDKGINLAFFPHGAIGVEFFFILTGLFLAKSVDSQLQTQPAVSSIGNDTFNYVLKKYRSIFPYHIAVFIMIFVITAIVENFNWLDIVLLFIQSIPNILLLQMTGIPGRVLNGIEWYLSVMMISSAVIYPLCKIRFQLFTKVIAPVSSLLILGYMGQTYGRLTGVLVWNGFFYRGMIRGFAEIMLGTFAYAIYKNYILPLNGKVSPLKRWLLTFVEWGSYAFTAVFVIMTFPSQYEFSALFFIFIAVILSYSGLTYSGRLFDNHISYFLGKFSLAVYVSQICAISLIRTVLSHLDEYSRIAAMLCLTLLFSIITLVTGDIIIRFFKNKNQYTEKS